MSKIDIVHWSDYASQPEVRICCTQEYGCPWGDSNLPKGIHKFDDTLYTFD